MYTGDVKVKYDEVRLVYSNTIMLFEYENPKFELEIGAGLKLRMEFANDQVKKDPSIDIKIETNTMVMKFINFNNSLGLGSSKPLEIATIEGETILMNYIIHGIGEQKLMHINLYARKVGGKN